MTKDDSAPSFSAARRSGMTKDDLVSKSRITQQLRMAKDDSCLSVFSVKIATDMVFFIYGKMFKPESIKGNTGGMDHVSR